MVAHQAHNLKTRFESYDCIQGRYEDLIKTHSTEFVSHSKRDTFGGVAQLGEHLLCKQGAMGSSPIISTIVTTQHE